MRLFHFSEVPDIAVFEPRPVVVPARRRPGFDWLNGALVWAIDDWHQPLYLFPRDCPRILIWPLEARTTHEDRNTWFGDSRARMLAYIEEGWRQAHASGFIYRYELPAARFESLDDAGMWVSREPAVPLHVERMDDLPARLAALDVELRVVPSLLALKGVWQTSLHASGIRLRNVEGRDDPGRPHSPR